MKKLVLRTNDALDEDEDLLFEIRALKKRK
jgi:hypothetical protein